MRQVVSIWQQQNGLYDAFNAWVRNTTKGILFQSGIHRIKIQQFDEYTSYNTSPLMYTARVCFPLQIRAEVYRDM